MDAGYRNYVSLLNELAQKNGLTQSFENVKSDGPAHNPLFTVRAVVNGKRYPKGEGRTKKDAKQNAAKNALSHLEREKPETTATSRSTNENVSELTQANYICWLNEHSQKHKLIFTAVENTKMSSSSSNLIWNSCKFVCDGREFPEAECQGKKEAKEAAAKLVHEELQKERQAEVLDDNGNRTQPASLSSASPDSNHVRSCESPTVDSNFIGHLNMYCQKNKLPGLDFKFENKTGPPHNPEFVYRVVLNKKSYPEGRGKTAKEAKQNAARLALCRLQSDSESQTTDPSTESTSQTSRSQSLDRWIVFTNTTPVPAPKNRDVKPKTKLAPNFQVSPTNIKERSPAAKQAVSKNPPPKSWFSEQFTSIVLVGNGGFGRVFKVLKKLEKKYYAVKIVKFNKKAQKEVDALALFEHQNIVRYHTSWIEEIAYRDESSQSSTTSTSGSGSECKYLYIQMEFCVGNTLEKWIKDRYDSSKRPPNQRQEAENIMKQVLDAVKYIHSKNLFHRDLKPANIMFGGEGGEKVKVGDFGLITEEDEDSDGGRMKRTINTGTRSYMAPEQKVQSSYDKNVDIFALGLIYFEMVWPLGTASEKWKIWSELRKGTFPEGFSEQFAFEHKLISQMLCEKPEKRPKASKLLTELDMNLDSLKMDYQFSKKCKSY